MPGEVPSRSNAHSRATRIEASRGNIPRTLLHMAETPAPAFTFNTLILFIIIELVRLQTGVSCPHLKPAIFPESAAVGKVKSYGPLYSAVAGVTGLVKIAR